MPVYKTFERSNKIKRGGIPPLFYCVRHYFSQNFQSLMPSKSSVRPTKKPAIAQIGTMIKLATTNVMS